MFGLNRSCELNKACKSNWISHYCGTCIALKQNYGNSYRLLLNNDSILLSLLSSTEQSNNKVWNYCFIRNKRKIQISNPSSHASQYSALISMLVASVKMEDWVIDNDGYSKYFRSILSLLSKNLKNKAEINARILGVDISEIHQNVSLQFEREK